MSTLIFSDVHVGDHKSGWEDFMRFLDKQPGVTRIIIAGDLCDCWVTRVSRALTRGAMLLDQLTQRFGSDNVTYLVGNHDADLMCLQPISKVDIRETIDLPYGPRGTLVLHGHQLDRSFYVNQFAPIAKINAWLVNKVDRLFGIDIRKFLMSMSDYVDGDLYDQMLMDFEFMVKETYGGKYSYVVTGHTHTSKIKAMGNIVYINCGDWIQHRTAVLVDDDTFRLVSYEDGLVEELDNIMVEK